MTESITLGRAIANARKARGKSLREIAEALYKEDGTPITPQYLNDIEHDRRTPSANILDQLSSVLDLAPEWLSYLAGTIPSELRNRPVSEDQVVKAYREFRRKLGG